VVNMLPIVDTVTDFCLSYGMAVEKDILIDVLCSAT
jgi:hypothetical protein